MNPVSLEVNRARAADRANSYPPKCRDMAIAIRMQDLARGDEAIDSLN